MKASINNHATVVELLIKADADPNLQNKVGYYGSIRSECVSLLEYMFLV